jgi:hypothetical protein
MRVRTAMQLVWQRDLHSREQGSNPWRFAKRGGGRVVRHLLVEQDHAGSIPVRLANQPRSNS